jgi:DNA repair exonuclease SbcCD ATPase subunit
MGSSGRVLIREADLTYEHDGLEDRKALAAKIGEAATAAGGYVSGEDEFSMTVRVPAPQLDDAIAQFEKLGKVTKKSLHVEEVTAQHTDLSIRIDNAKRLRERLQGLLAQANDVKSMLEVEKELARVTQELELLEAQLRGMENRVTLATVQMTFEQEVSPGPVGWVFVGVYRGVKWLFIWD